MKDKNSRRRISYIIEPCANSAYASLRSVYLNDGCKVIDCYLGTYSSLSRCMNQINDNFFFYFDDISYEKHIIIRSYDSMAFNIKDVKKDEFDEIF